MKMKRVFVILLIAFFALSIQAQEKQNITLEDILVKGTFRAQSVSGLSSMKDGEHYTTLENNSRIVKYSYKTGNEVSVVLDIPKIKDAPIKSFSDYEFSPDETKVLLTTSVQPIYRHSFTATYFIWNFVTEEFTSLSEKGAQQVATFSPDGERVAFVRGNNIFIKNLKFGTENQVTFDGEKNKIINGIPDWVYEEEFGYNKALWWSPDSKFLAFVRFDESEVPDFSMQLYAGESPQLGENKLYPGKETFKYPKAGEKNSDVTVLVHELRSKTNMPVNIGENKNIYIPRLNWTPDANNVVVMRLNRLQNNLDVLYANPYTGDSRPLFSEKNKRYIDESFLDNMIYLEDGKFVITSERDGWSHLYLFDNNGFEIKQLTKGKFDVTKFYGYDNVRKVYYYQAAAESPLRREVYFVSQDEKKKGKISNFRVPMMWFSVKILIITLTITAAAKSQLNYFA
jgi:dipeptidyl-peptidase 4